LFLQFFKLFQHPFNILFLNIAEHHLHLYLVQGHSRLLPPLPLILLFSLLESYKFKLLPTFECYRFTFITNCFQSGVKSI
jgi:hypothetical protein